MIQLAYAALTSAFESTKHGISKSTLSHYAKDTTVINMLFIKHIVKTILYISLVLLLKNETLKHSFSELTNMLTDTAKFKFSNNMLVFLAILLVASVEVAYAFPYYTGLRKFELGTFILLITIFTIIFNMIVGRLFFDEKLNSKKIIGTLFCIAGISIIHF